MAKQKSVKRVLIYFILGTIAILSLYPLQRAMIEEQLKTIPVDPGMSVSALTLLSMVNPLIFLILALTAGYFLAEKTGFYSIVVHSGNFRTEIKKGLLPAVIGGTVTGVLIILFDFFMRPFLPDGLKLTIQLPRVVMILPELLYGGIFEELMMRFGLMTFFTWLLWKIFLRKQKTPPDAVYITAIIVTALLFALGHLPATSILTEMTGPVWFRMIFLNGIGGIIFGWLYWKYSLESAMIAHMTAHIAKNLCMVILWVLF